MVSLLLVGCAQLTPGIELDLQVAPHDAPTVVERAHLVVSAVELVPCAPLARGAPFSALAHTPSTPTRIGEPLVIDLLDPAPQRLGALLPPPADWCWLDVWLTPADADARSLPDDLEGRTFHIDGPVVVQSGAAVVTSVPLALSAHEPGLTTVTLDVDAGAWLDPVDWDRPPTELSADLQEALPDVLRAQ